MGVGAPWDAAGLPQRQRFYRLDAEALRPSGKRIRFPNKPPANRPPRRRGGDAGDAKVLAELERLLDLSPDMVRVRKWKARVWSSVNGSL